MIRRPAVAGRFYPSSPDALKRQIREFMIESMEKNDVLGIVSPHAGYIYSGAVAGAVYSSINIPDVVVMVGPNHTGLGETVSLMASGEWEMPDGRVRINNELSAAIVSNSRYIKTDNIGHIHEHSLEVQIPFLQYIKKDFEIVPITMMTIDYKICEDVGMAISKAVKIFNKHTLIVASTDMTHYESHESASLKDKMAIEQILELNPKGLFDTVKRNNISMCGIAPTTAVLIACKNLGAKKAKLIKYMTSGEVSGDYGQVVGYAGITIK